jgi:hypothetical protein
MRFGRIRGDSVGTNVGVVVVLRCLRVTRPTSEVVMVADTDNVCRMSLRIS